MDSLQQFIHRLEIGGGMRYLRVGLAVLVVLHEPAMECWGIRGGKAATDLHGLVEMQTESPRALWLMVPSGPPVDGGPADITLDEVEKIYFLAWKLGCKGITVYREGSREGILVTEDQAE